MISTMNSIEHKVKVGTSSSMNKIKQISIIMGVTMIIGLILIINNNNDAFYSRRRRLVLSDVTYTDIDTDITIIYNFDTSGLYCYDNETSISWDSDYAGKNVTCSKSGYEITGCSAKQTSTGYNGVYYGVTSDFGKSCYSKYISTFNTASTIESKGSVKLQARCCKSSKTSNPLKIYRVYSHGGYNNNNENKCNSITCPYSIYVDGIRTIPIGNAISTGKLTSYMDEYQGIKYDDSIWGMYTYHGNQSEINKELFCGAMTNSTHRLKCETYYGDVSTTSGSIGALSNVTCPTNYKMLSCDSAHYNYACSKIDTSKYWIEGSYITNNTCYSYGIGNIAVARCCYVQQI